MIKFIRPWRDTSDKSSDKLGKYYPVMSTARFNAPKESQLIKKGVAVKAIVNTNGAPKNLETK